MSPADEFIEDAPPLGEEIHLPGPSVIPVVNAAGIALALAGLMISTIVSIVGLVIFLWSTVRWIRDTRRGISQLPLEH